MADPNLAIGVQPDDPAAGPFEPARDRDGPFPRKIVAKCRIGAAGLASTGTMG
jgi:hypothetical protein